VAGPVALYKEGADFRDADLRGANFERVDPGVGDPSNDSYPGQLPPVDPSESGIEGALFGGALADGGTSWPFGFDPQAEGVTMP
jgi:uncharacterized protein YjbI with pentapeptide repeats